MVGYQATRKINTFFKKKDPKNITIIDRVCKKLRNLLFNKKSVILSEAVTGYLGAKGSKIFWSITEFKNLPLSSILIGSRSRA